jgi:hypothetical protein
LAGQGVELLMGQEHVAATAGPEQAQLDGIGPEQCRGRTCHSSFNDV